MVILGNEVQIILRNIFEAFKVLSETNTTDSLKDLVMTQSLSGHDGCSLEIIIIFAIHNQTETDYYRNGDNLCGK